LALEVNDKAPATMSESAYLMLRADIQSGLLPASAKLRAEDLATRLGTSASPMREALSRLAGEGLVVSKGQRGYWVAPISLKEFREITQLRLQLEVQALRASIENGSIEWEGRVMAAFHRLSKVELLLDSQSKKIRVEWERENRQYHWELISCCPSEWILRLTSLLYDHSSRYRLPVVALSPVPSKVMLKEHRSILDAALARDSERAALALSQHILNSARNIERVLATAF
jgi:GntR family carbon starvation induced transcriptional regulator